MWWAAEAAKGAKIAVWWDLKDCPIPEGYDAGRVRASLEAAFKERGYSGPVSITAYGDQTQTPGHILQGLLSTGISVAHNRSESTNYIMHRDIVEWRGQNPPPATMMIISGDVGGDLSWDLARLQQRTQYNLFRAYVKMPNFLSVLLTSANWLWNELLLVELEDNNRIETALGMLCCKSCNFNTQSLKKFKKHLSSYNHARQETAYPMDTEVFCVTKSWSMNHLATPEFATTQILVWWDMFDCPIPEGYDPLRVRPSLEVSLKILGYSGPVSITAYGDLNRTPDHLLRGLSSTGVNLAHTVFDVTYNRMFGDLFDWVDSNPPPANIMVISDTHYMFEFATVEILQKQKHNLLIGYSFRPSKMSILLPSAELLWHTLLEGADKRRHILQKCSESDRVGGECTSMFYCKLCFRDFRDPYFKSFDDLRTHLSSEKHTKEEYRLAAFFQSKWKNRKLTPLVQYDLEHRKQWLQVRKSPNIKRMRTGFRFVDHIRRLRTPKISRR